MKELLRKYGISKRMILVGAFFFFLYMSVAYAAYYADRHVGDIDGNREFQYPSWGYDSPEYTKLADGLLLRHEFTTEAGLAPDVLRTPGYPVLLFLSKLMTGKFWPIVPVQIFCALLVALLTYKIGIKLGAPKVGAVAATLFLISPSTIFHSIVFMNELTFMTAFLLSVYTLFFTPKELTKKWWYAPLLSALFLSSATYIRPITLYAFPLFAFLYGALTWGRGHKHVLKVGISYSLFFLVFVVPWIYHNGVKSHVYSFSTIGTYNLVFFNAPDFLEKTFGAEAPQTKAYGAKLLEIPMYKARPQKSWDEIAKLPKEVLTTYPRAYLKYHLSYLSVFFLSSGARYDVQMINYPKVKAFFGLNTGAPSIISEIKAHHFKNVLVTFGSQIVFTLERMGLLLLCIGALLSPLVAKEHRARTLMLVLLILIAYFALLTGPAAIPRYRLPIEPLLFILGLFAWSRWYAQLKSKLTVRSV